MSDNNKDYTVQWTEKVEKSITLQAHTEEEALTKWELGDYDERDVDYNDVDLLPDRLGGSIEVLEG